MKEHYGLTDANYQSVLNRKISVKDLFHMAKKFNSDISPVSKLSLMYYVDEHGDFTEGKKDSDFVAQLIFGQLPTIEKIEVGSYIEDWENGFKDEESD